MRRLHTTPGDGRRAVLVAGGSAVLGVVPAFLVGSLAVLIREELGFDRAQLGFAIAAFFLASAVAALPGGRLSERLGARATVLLAAAVSGTAMLGIAVTARSWWGLLAWLVLAGVANGVAQPAANLVLARGVGQHRQGLAFGIKQSAIPMASLVAGASVPLVGLTLGWRWAFAGVVLGSVLLAAIMPADPYRSPAVRSGRRMREGDAPAAPLLVLAVAGACGSMVGTSLASFFVESAVSAGVSPGPAGVLLVIGSAIGIGARLLLGRSADRRGRGHLQVVALLLALGAAGFVALAFSAWTPALLAGTALGFGAGWAWPGLLTYAVVVFNRNAPAAATSITQTGVFVGGVVGPAAFGSIASATSFAVAWFLAAVVNLVGAACVVLSLWMLRRAGAAATPED